MYSVANSPNRLVNASSLVIEKAEATDEEAIEEDSTEDLEEEEEEKLEEYTIPVSAKEGADGEKESEVFHRGEPSRFR